MKTFTKVEKIIFMLENKKTPNQNTVTPPSSIPYGKKGGSIESCVTAHSLPE